MKEYFNENPMTSLMFAIFGLVALVGGALVLFDSAGNLSYEQYLDNLTKFALAVGILGAGKAIKRGLGGEEGIPYADDGAGPYDQEADPEGEVPEAPISALQGKAGE